MIGLRAVVVKDINLRPIGLLSCKPIRDLIKSMAIEAERTNFGVDCTTSIFRY